MQIIKTHKTRAVLLLFGYILSLASVLISPFGVQKASAATTVKMQLQGAISVTLQSDTSEMVLSITDNSAFGDGGLNAAQQKYIAGTYHDSNTNDLNFRFGHTEDSCDSNNSEIKFVGTDSHQGQVSEDTGWVGIFYVNRGGDCKQITTPLAIPRGMFDTRNPHWIDETRVVVGGKSYIDIDPWDGNGEYRLANATPCDPVVTIGDDGSDGKLLMSAVGLRALGNSVCEFGGISLINPENKNLNHINAYRIDEDTIFMPVFRLGKDNPTCLGSSVCTDHDDRIKGIFTRIGGNTGNAVYDLIEAGSASAASVGKASGSWINTSDSQQKYRGCRVRGLGVGIQCGSIEEVTISISERSVPSVYNIADVISLAVNPATTEPLPSCESQNVAILSWLVCGIVNLADSMVGNLFNVAENLLDLNTQEVRDDAALKSMWSYFRALATFLLLAVGMVMVISQAIGGKF